MPTEELEPETLARANERLPRILGKPTPEEYAEKIRQAADQQVATYGTLQAGRADQCPSCEVQLTRTGRNRLSDCGHMRWTVKGWTAKEEAPASQPQPAGKLSREQMQTFDTLLAARDETRAAYLSAQEVFEAFRDEITAK